MVHSNSISRRDFLRTTAAAGAATFLAPSINVLGANNTVRVGVIGVGGKGSQHLKSFSKLSGVKIVAVCDPDESHATSAAKRLKGGVACHKDLRKMLEMKDLDAVVIATPNHWHAPAAILACQAGKDVYVEKPVAHTIWEGRQMVKAARKYNRIVQGGTQQRSCPSYAKIRADLEAGKFGKIELVHTMKLSTRSPIGKISTPIKIPDNIDYNLWCGPAPMTPVMRKRLHYDWHWQWNWGNGEMGNWGPHIVDDLRNILNWDDVPSSMIAAGGRFWDDNGQTPNMHAVLFEHNGLKFITEIRNLPIKKGSRGSASYLRSRGHNVIICENGIIRSGRGGGAAYDKKTGKRIKSYKGDGGKGHAANFVKAIRSRKVSDLNCDVEVAHQSTMMCLLANIAYRIGHLATVDQVEQAMKDHKDAVDTIKAQVAQIKANQEPLTPLQLGPKLTFDPKAERFTGANADQANALLRYEMRKEFAVPDEV